MTNLDRIHVINEKALSGKNYLISLMTQGKLCALLSDSDIERIQMESLELLAGQTEKWSRGESSSIRVEKAQELLGSIYYTVGLTLKAYHSPEDAIEALKKEQLSVLFQDGLVRIIRKIQAVRLIHRKIKKNLFQTKNVFYRSTVVDGINGFFKLYSPAFSAQEIHITADYPTFLEVTDLAGIEFIERYLRNIACENRFCLCFSADRVHHLLCGLDENYQQILMNIYEPVLAAALGCILTEYPVRELSCDLEMLKHLFSGKTAEQLTGILSAALPQLTEELGCPPELIRYMRSSLPKLSGLLHRAMKLKSLETVILTPRWPEDESRILVSYGDRMDDREYTKVLQQLLWCDGAEKKTEIILEQIHSLGDLLEILRDSEPTLEELTEMFRRFPAEVIAMLMRQYPNGDFLSDEREKNIYSALKTFCDMLPLTARERLERASQALRFDAK